MQRILLEHHVKELDELSQKFWDKVNTLLSKVLIERAQGKNYNIKIFVLIKTPRLFSGSSFVKQALEGEYPKFLRIFLDLRKRLKERLQSISIYKIK